MIENILSNLTLEQALWLVGGGTALLTLVWAAFSHPNQREAGHSRAFRKYHGN